jgi:hypothetical protein
LQPGAQIPWTDVTGKPTFATVATTGAYSDLTGIPSTFPPSAHTHPAADISDSTAAGRSLLTAADAAAQRSLLSVETTTQLNTRDTNNRNRANHTGTQSAATITGLAAVATSGSAADLTAGTLPAARFDDTAHGSRSGGSLHAVATGSVAGFMAAADKTKLDGIATGANNYTHPNHSGDVTSAGDGATTIAAGAVTNAKLANMATARIKGRVTAGTGSPEDLTGTQATALLDTFTSGAKGLAPASGGGTTNFLRADGTWAAPPGGGGGSPGGSSGQVQFNSAGSFGGAANVRIEGDELRLPVIATPTAPASGGLKLYAGDIAGMVVPKFRGPSGNEWLLQPHLGFGQFSIFQPAGGTTVTNLGLVPTTVGTATTAGYSVGSRRVRLRRIEYLVTTAATTAVAGWRSNSATYTIGGANDWEGGFYAVMHGGPSTGVTNGSHRFFMGMLGNAAAPTDVNPSTLLRMVGIGYDAADTQVQIMTNDGSGAATKIALGAAFPKPNADRAFTYRLELYSPPGSTQSISYRVTYLETGAVAEGTITTDLPGTSDLLQPYTYVSVGGVSSVVGLAIGSMIFGTEY